MKLALSLALIAFGTFAHADISCPSSKSPQALSALLRAQKSCDDVATAFESCVQAKIPMYDALELVDETVIPKCERAIAKDHVIALAYKVKSKVCDYRGVSNRQTDDAVNVCERTLAIDLGRVAELKLQVNR